MSKGLPTLAFLVALVLARPPESALADPTKPVVLTEQSATATLVTTKAYNPNSFSVWLFYTLTSCRNVDPTPAQICNDAAWTQARALPAFGSTSIYYTPLVAGRSYHATIHFVTTLGSGEYNTANPPPFE